MLAIAAVGAIAAHDQQRKAGNQQQDALEDAEALRQNDMARQQDQQHEASQGEINAHAQAAMQDMAHFDALVGENGGGNTAVSNRAAGSIQQDEGLATMQRNAQLGQNETAFASLASARQAQSSIASISRPSWVNTGLQIGGAAAGAYAQHQNMESIKKGRNG